MWSDATVGDLRKLHEETKDKPYLSSLDPIATGPSWTGASLTTRRCFPRSAAVNPMKEDGSD